MIKLHRENTVNQMDKLSTLEKAARIELLTIRGFEHGVAALPTTKNVEKYLDQLVRIHESGRKLLESLKSN